MHIVILGGGIAGLLGAYALRAYKPTIIEASGKLGGNFAAGGLKYIHDTPEVRQLLKELDLPFKPYKPVGAILLQKETLSHPETMAQMSTMERYRVQLLHWNKTRATSVGLRDDCMNDPLGSHQALQCDHLELLRRLECKVRDAGCDVRLGSNIVSIGDSDGLGMRCINLREGLAELSIGYDTLVPTLSLGILDKLAPWARFPRAETTKLGIYQIELPIHLRPAWDYLYTPDIEWISRIAHTEAHTLMVEVPWHQIQFEAAERNNPTPTMFQVLPVIERILKEEVGLEGVCVDERFIPGHLRPLGESVFWPPGWFPLGRFAQWDSRATADKVYARALSFTPGLPG